MSWTHGQQKPDLFTIEAVMEMFGWAKGTYYSLVREGKVPRPKWYGNAWKYTQEEIDAYILLVGRWEPGSFDPDNPPVKPVKPPAKGAKKNEEDGEPEES